MRHESIDPVSDPRWRELVERAPDASVFHHPSWLGLLAGQYGYRLQACCVTDGNAEVVAGLPLAEIRSAITPRRLVALPFSDLCRPLASQGAGGAREALAEAVEGERREAGLPLEVHGEFPELPSGHVVQRFYHHLLALQPDVEAVERGFSKSQVRAAVKKARKAGVTVERRTDRDALDAFYGLHMRTRKRLGVPTQPKRFVRRFAELFADGLGFVLLARLGGETAAAAVFLTFRGTVTYKYGASEARFLKERPNNLLFWEAISWGCGNGFDTFDFGRTDLDNEGLRRFKGNWGAQELPLAYTYAPDSPGDSGDGLVGRLMKSTIQRSPAPVGRMLGEALYKHYG